jgi:hypothetical protein
MKAKSIALYASIAANVVLLVLAVWPKTDYNIALGQAASTAGNYTAVASKGDSDQDVVWLANKVTGQLVVFQYQLENQDEPIQVVGQRDLRTDLEERQVGNLLLVGSSISSMRSVVCVADTDSDKMVVYSYTRSNRLVEGVQRIDLRQYFSRQAVVPTPATAPAAEGTGY